MTDAPRRWRARPPLADPLGRRTAFSVRGGDADIATEPDDPREAQFRQIIEQLAVAEAAVGEDRHRRLRRQHPGKAGETRILDVVPLARQFVLQHRQPQQRRRPAVPGHQIERQRRLSVGVEIGPVHGDNDLLAAADRLRNPLREHLPGTDAGVAQQPVDLFDRMLGQQSPRLRQRMADHRNRQRRPGHHPQRAVGQRRDPFGVNMPRENPVKKPPNVGQTKLRTRHPLHFPTPTFQTFLSPSITYPRRQAHP